MIRHLCSNRAAGSYLGATCNDLSSMNREAIYNPCAMTGGRFAPRWEPGTLHRRHVLQIIPEQERGEISDGRGVG